MIYLLATRAFACPDLAAETERAAAALVAGDFATVTAALDEGSASSACAPATTSQLARYWVVAGASAQLQGQPGADGYFAAARAAAPEVFDERLGPDLKKAWQKAAIGGDATLALEPPRPGFVDGAAVGTWPAHLGATTHLVQIVDADGTVLFSKVLSLAPGEDAYVETGLGTVTEPIAIADAAAPVEPKRKKSPVLLVAAGVAAAGAGACAGVAYAQESTMRDAEDIPTLDAAFNRQKAFGYSSYGLAGAAVVALGLHIVIP